jgi:malonate decarboxylase alpha subunit
VQTIETFSKGGVPAFVETLDAVEVGKKSGMPIAPIMIYGDDVNHVVTEEGIAFLYKAEGIEERRRALAGVAGVSPIGLRAKPEETNALRRKGLVAYPEDIGVQRLKANRSLLAARGMEDLVACLAACIGHQPGSGVGNGTSHPDPPLLCSGTASVFLSGFACEAGVALRS